jgi:RNA polymerase sigma-70 factor (ECF subfamily)
VSAAKLTPVSGVVAAGGGQIVPLRRSELSDEALLASCGVGDPAALGQLFDRHHEAVYRLISRLLRAEPAETDDLVQLTFMAAWRSARGYTGKGSVKSFLFGIAANIVRRHFRTTRRRRDALASIPEPAPGGTPHEAASRAQQVKRLAAALDELPHDLRAAYVLCDLEDLSGAEAARALDVREGTLWRRLHEARRALRDAIEGGGSR